jgi:hypothetical protein
MTHSLAHPANQLYLNNNMQNANTPDVDLDRDLTAEALGAELGREAAERSQDKGVAFRVNLATIAISAFVFLIILAWFDFIQTAFFVYLDPDSEESMIPSPVKLWYACLLTGLCSILVILIMYYSGLRF